ncbi:hypothetical protein ABBQ32_008268 [Trebouxia sp. C0010 RCD-2024]
MTDILIAPKLPVICKDRTTRHSALSAMAEEYRVVCACKAVSITATGPAVSQCLCHCTDCAEVYQMTPAGFVLFPADQLCINTGKEKLKAFSQKTPSLKRYFCEDCGFKTHHTRDGIPLVGTLSNNLPGFDFQPQVHLYCKSAPADRLQAYAGDGSTKFVDMPKEFGGSGEQMTC